MACTDTRTLNDAHGLTDTVYFTDEQPATDPIADQVQRALFRHQTPLHLRERRREQRHPYPYAVYLTPLNHRGEPDLSDTFVVIGKHLSGHGFDFYHNTPVPYRRVLASFDCGNGSWVAFVLDLGWCRFNRNGWYDNGGRFLEVAESPFNQCHLPDEYVRGELRANA